MEWSGQMNVGKTLFAQLMEFVPWTSFSRIVDHWGGNSGVRTLTCAEHFRVMAFAQLTWRESLRDIESTLGANAGKLYGMGLRQAVRRSTLADANESRDWRIWADLAALLIRRARSLHAGEELGLELDDTVYCLDSTTIDLCMSLFPWAPYRATKAAVKVHTLLDLRGSIPAFIHVSDGRLHEIHVLDMLQYEPGAFYVMDRSYQDFARFYAIHQAGAFFVTRAKVRMDARRVYSMPVDRSTGVICDQRVIQAMPYGLKNYPEHFRRIRYAEPETGKKLIFITNNTALPALCVCALYKSRWQVELFFKWIKHNLRIKHFLGTSENAVKTQIWCSVATYVLIAIVKKELKLPASLHTLLQILSVSVFEKTQLQSALSADRDDENSAPSAKQLILFEN
jgi:Domain of unknown function (DUF4372)/Transposase DDE domain